LSGVKKRSRRERGDKPRTNSCTRTLSAGCNARSSSMGESYCAEEPGNQLAAGLRIKIDVARVAGRPKHDTSCEGRRLRRDRIDADTAQRRHQGGAAAIETEALAGRDVVVAAVGFLCDPGAAPAHPDGDALSIFDAQRAAARQDELVENDVLTGTTRAHGFLLI